MKFLKFVCLGLLSAVIAGCGGKDAAKTSGAEPKVADNARFVALCRNIDCAALDPMCKLFKEKMEEAMRKDGDAFSKYEEFIEKTGLKGNEYKWVLLSFGDIDFEAVQRNPAQLSFSAVACVKHDSKKLLDEIVESAKEEDEAQLKEIEIEGVRALSVEAEVGINDMRFYCTSLNDELIVLTTTKTDFRNQIALYRDGKPGSEKFRSLLGKRDNLVGFAVSDLGAFCEEFEEKSGEVIPCDTPFGSVDVKKFKDFEIGVKANGNRLDVYAELSTASEKSAEEIDSILKQALKMTLKQLANVRGQSEEGDAALEILESADIKLLGPKATVSFRIPEKVMKMALDKVEQSMR
jgi:hypothetical protein